MEGNTELLLARGWTWLAADAPVVGQWAEVAAQIRTGVQAEKQSRGHTRAHGSYPPLGVVLRWPVSTDMGSTTSTPHCVNTAAPHMDAMNQY